MWSTGADEHHDVTLDLAVRRRTVLPS